MSNLYKSKNGTFILPGIISALIPGVGQFIKGHIVKGLAVIGVALAYYVVSFVLGWIPLVGGLIWVVGALAWAINVLDALFSKKDLNTSTFKS